jgi:uncharacterized membrane protein HdeD (DUF308 family)
MTDFHFLDVLFGICWFSCGPVSILLAMLSQKLRDRDFKFWDCEFILAHTAGNILFIMILGPLFLIYCIALFINNLKYFETREQYVLRKFKS